MARFEGWLRALITDSGVRAVTVAGTFAEHGEPDPPFGLVLATATGAQLWLHPVGTSPDGGDDRTQPERVVHGEPLPAVPAVKLTGSRGRLHIADVDDWLYALIVNAGSTEVSSVSRISDNPGYYHSRGLKLRFHNGATITCMWRYIIRAGGRRPTEPYQPVEVV